MSGSGPRDAAILALAEREVWNEDYKGVSHDLAEALEALLATSPEPSLEHSHETMMSVSAPTTRNGRDLHPDEVAFGLICEALSGKVLNPVAVLRACLELAVAESCGAPAPRG